jgi:hypothetical protein
MRKFTISKGRVIEHVYGFTWSDGYGYAFQWGSRWWSIQRKIEHYFRKRKVNVRM